MCGLFEEIRDFAFTIFWQKFREINFHQSTAYSYHGMVQLNDIPICRFLYECYIEIPCAYMSTYLGGCNLQMH